MSSPIHRHCILDISELKIARGHTVLLNGISWRVDAGQQWVILGENGSGKTSLLRAITGYLSPTAGEITVLGRHYGRSDWRELRKRIGLVTSALQASIPAAEKAIETVISGKYAQLDLWGKITAGDTRTARQLLTLVGGAYLADREWIFLSQGERQRVLIARALMARPELLILDEPCSGLDPVAREHFLASIDRLAAQHFASFVLVTHHVEEITPAFTHTLLLRQGKVVAAGSIQTTLTRRNLAVTFGTPLRLLADGKRRYLRFPKQSTQSFWM